MAWDLKDGKAGAVARTWTMLFKRAMNTSSAATPDTARRPCILNYLRSEHRDFPNSRVQNSDRYGVGRSWKIPIW